MEEFIKYSFIGDSYKQLDMNTIYNCYVMYCKLFEYDPLDKFKFIELYNDYLLILDCDNINCTHNKGQINEF